MEETEKNRGGRPATGVTPKRDIRIGPAWDDLVSLLGPGEKMAAVLTGLIEREARRRRKVERSHE
jgi:hypothetical protein